ncbi:hypothetical protein ABZ569_34095 [Streptomyces albus]
MFGLFIFAYLWHYAYRHNVVSTDVPCDVALIALAGTLGHIIWRRFFGRN